MKRESLLSAVILAFVLLIPTAVVYGQDADDASSIPNTGQTITPLAPKGAQFVSLNLASRMRRIIWLARR